MVSVQNTKTLNEILWSQIFNNTTKNSEWLNDISLSPGRWAAGYPFLYALYRALDEIRPVSILELGLGQTTKLISRYSSLFENANHTVVEHDKEWIDFFGKQITASERTKIVTLPITYKAKYKTDDSVVSYVGFKERFTGNKYDMLCIDGPFGYMAKDYSRVDILSILPDCLKEDFVIFLDDSERAGEKNTIAEIKEILTKAKLSFHTRTYSGSKDTIVFASERWRFLCSM